MRKGCALVLALVLTVGLLGGCSGDKGDTEPPAFTEWRDAYAMVLKEYLQSERMFFLLHDFDQDDIPELIIAGEHMGEDVDVVYTFRDGEVLSLEYGEDVQIAVYLLSARCGAKAAPNNAPGLITHSMGPSAGAFGADMWYTRIVIDGRTLKADASGRRRVDVETLHTLFDNYGTDTNDHAALDTAVREHTYFYINDAPVSEDELYHMFEMEGNALLPRRIAEYAGYEASYYNEFLSGERSFEYNGKLWHGYDVPFSS